MSADVEPSVDESAARLGEHLGRILGAALEPEVTVESLGAEPVTAETAVDDEAPLVDLRCQGVEGARFLAHLLLPRPAAALLASLAHAGSPEPEAKDDPLDDGAVAALGELLNGWVAEIGPSFADHGVMPLEIQQLDQVESPGSGGDWLGGAAWTRVRFLVVIEGAADCVLDLLLPGPGGDREDGGDPLLVIVDEDPTRIPVSELAGQVGMPIETCAPERAAAEGAECLLQATAVVLPWQVETSSAIERLERLCADPRTRSLRILLAHPAPKRSQVDAALRAGADGVVLLPYEGAELRRRLAGAAGAASD